MRYTNLKCSIMVNPISKEITHVFEKAFQIDLGDNITRSFIDIKTAKQIKPDFKSLQAALETKIENDLN